MRIQRMNKRGTPLNVARVYVDSSPDVRRVSRFLRDRGFYEMPQGQMGGRVPDHRRTFQLVYVGREGNFITVCWPNPNPTRGKWIIEEGTGRMYDTLRGVYKDEEQRELSITGQSFKGEAAVRLLGLKRGGN